MKSRSNVKHFLSKKILIENQMVRQRERERERERETGGALNSNLETETYLGGSLLEID